MTVDPAKAAASLELDGTRYSFCSLPCFGRFRAQPERYLDANPSTRSEEFPQTERLPHKREYTCPMHPEVVQNGPGVCPLCGMALEPTTASLAPERNPEAGDMVRRFRIALGFTIPLLALMLTALLTGWQAPNWLEFVIATPVVLWCGRPIFERAWMSVIHRSPNMFTLIGLGAGV